MSKQTSALIYGRLFILAAAILALGLLVAHRPQMSWNIFLAAMGFSAVVFVHECGHFFVARATDIKIEAFSIFLPPILVGIRRTCDGFRVRVLPRLFPRDNDPDGDGLLSFTVGRPGRAGETEYRIGLVPVAGYVKMLGQDDLGADKQVVDPRSFGNKPILARMAVIAAGVTFNVIAALALMTVVYLIGMPRVAPVVGGVVSGSAAQRAGLQPGDRILSIGTKRDDLDFGDILMASALSNPGEAVPVTVQKRDGSTANLSIVAEASADAPVRLFGIDQPMSLTVARLNEPEVLLKTTGLKGGDRVVAVNGTAVQYYWELEQIVATALAPKVTLTVDRLVQDGQVERISVQIPTELTHASGDVTSEDGLNHVHSLVPRLQITGIADTAAVRGKPTLLRGDVILAVGDIENPTFKELRDVVSAHEDKDLHVEVLRTDPNGVERAIPIVVRPRRPRGSDRVLIGIVPSLDTRHPVVAKAIAVKGLPALPVPRGATITAIAGTPVNDFYDVIRLLREQAGRQVVIEWKGPEKTPGSASVTIQDPQEWIKTRAVLAEFIPFEYLQEQQKADHVGQAVVMGAKRSFWFIVQTYVTVKQLVSRSVRLDAMSGPVGIATVTYKAAEQSWVTFLYLLAFISANLAVVNFLPIPVVDGGVFVLLIVEKIKGSPLSIRVQEIITYAGLVLIASLFLYLTYNDIIRLVGG